MTEGGDYNGVTGGEPVSEIKLNLLDSFCTFSMAMTQMECVSVHVRLPPWQPKAQEMISTSLNACLALSDQTGSPFLLMWSSSRRTWWLGTRGVTTPASTCAEPTSRRPENSLPRQPNFMCLVETFYVSSIFHPWSQTSQFQEFHFWSISKNI